MLHVELFLIADVIVNAALSKHRIYTIMLPEKNVAEFLLSFVLFRDFFCFSFLAKFVNESIDEWKFK